MPQCNNCKAEFSYTDEGALMLRKVRADGLMDYITAICAKCTTDVKVAKLVVRRDKEGLFQYDQYSAIEMVKKAFGKTA